MSRITSDSWKTPQISLQAQQQVFGPARQESAVSAQKKPDAPASEDTFTAARSAQGIAWGGPTTPAGSPQVPPNLRRAQNPGAVSDYPVITGGPGSPPPVGEKRGVLEPIETNRSFKSGDVFDYPVITGQPGSPPPVGEKRGVLEPIETDRTFKSGDVFDY